MTVELQGIAEWRLLEQIGEGKHAEVYRAMPEEGGDESRPVALKILRKAYVGDENEVQAFETRHRVARRLSDQAAGAPFVSVHDVGTADDRPYAVMELVDGLALPELGTQKKKGFVSGPAAVFIIKRILRALSAAAQLKEPIAHGRLEAESLLIENSGELRLMGFGQESQEESDLLALARLADTLTTRWPVEVDSWIDRLKSTKSPLWGPNEALAAFPHDVFPDDVDVRGRRALSRAVKRARAAKEEPSASEVEPPKPKAKKKKKAEHTESHTESNPPAEPFGDSIRQARVVMWFCVGVIMLAMAIEIIAHGG
jgi:serine/threonine protein kinase